METIPDTTNNHLSGETLEQYVRGKLSASVAARVSEHLFECDACSDLYDRETQVFACLRSAAEASPEAEVEVRPFWSRIALMPVGPVFSAASALVLAILLVPRLSYFNSPSPAVAELTAYRSAGAATQSVPANRNLVLRLDTAGLDSKRGFRAEIADAGGRKVWDGNPVLHQDRQEVALKTLPSGQYWVRVYAGDDTELLREYSLIVK